MFELIDRPTCFDREFFEPYPDQKSTRNMIALNPGFATFAALQTGHLFAFAVHLLNLPTEATRLLRGRRRNLSYVVGDDIIRAVCGHRNPETLHFVVVGKPFDFDPLALLQFGLAPPERIHPLIGLRAARIIHRAIIAQRTVVNLFQGLDEEQQVFGGVPGVHQHRVKWQFFLIHDVRQHVLHVIQLGFAVPVRVIEPIIQEPELVRLGIDIDTGHDADALDDGFGIATPLPPHQFNGKGVVLIQHRVIKDQIRLRRRHDLRPHVVPDQARRELFGSQIAIDLVVRERLAMVGKIGQRVIDLTDQQILAVI